MPRRTHRREITRPTPDVHQLAAQADFLDRFARAGRLTGPRTAAAAVGVGRGAAREAIASGRPDARFRPVVALESPA